MRTKWFTLALVATLAACSSDDPAGPSGGSPEPGNGTPVTMKGILVGAGLSGELELTIAGSAAAMAASPMFSSHGTLAVVAVTGCAYLSTTACVTITGTYNTDTDALNFTTANPALTFTGSWVNGVIEGTYAGAFSGDFVVTQGTVKVYCGFFDGADSGDWNLALTGSASPYQVTGVFDSGNGPERFDGTATGNGPFTLNITFEDGTATGTLTATGGSGTWRLLGSSVPDGSWTATSADCRS